MSSLSSADYLILIVLGISAFLGWIRGFVTTILGIVIFGLGILIGLMFKGPVGALILGADPLDTSTWDEIVGFMVVFALVLVIGKILRGFIEHLIDQMNLSGTDRMLGLVFGIFLGGLFVVVLIIFFEPVISETGWFKNSTLVPFFSSFVDEAESLLAKLIGFM